MAVAWDLLSQGRATLSLGLAFGQGHGLRYALSGMALAVETAESLPVWATPSAETCYRKEVLRTSRVWPTAMPRAKIGFKTALPLGGRERGFFTYACDFFLVLEEGGRVGERCYKEFLYKATIKFQIDF